MCVCVVEDGVCAGGGALRGEVGTMRQCLAGLVLAVVGKSKKQAAHNKQQATGNGLFFYKRECSEFAGRRY